ncbi:MAG: hypothetical protein AAFU79_03125 [Myxococcota bacterium]
MRCAHAILLGLGLLTVSDRAEGAPWVTGTATVADRFILEVRVESYETFVDTRPLEGGHPNWHWRPTSRELRVRWGPDGPGPTSASTLSVMLDHLVSARGLVLEDTTLRMELSPYAYAPYAERLARFAAEDPEWSKRTKRTGGRGLALHQYVVETTRQQPLHPELDALFAPYGHRPHLYSVEKCLRSTRRSDTKTRGWLRERGLSTKRSLPLGCLMANLRFEVAVDSP